ncbi:hypothetical protein EGW08_018082, partial [Elysia chlorotica]
ESENILSPLGLWINRIVFENWRYIYVYPIGFNECFLFLNLKEHIIKAMDFDSSSKFISSLAKFLQSLCNGYVEFNNGVEVIGHIYINVDTGKKIDYVLNEKVCKTDENSVTFISNSFHAQPAEKPKQVEKVPKSNTDGEIVTGTEEDEIVIMDEPESENIGTLPHHQQHQHKKSRPSKRSHSHSQGFSSGQRQFSKLSKTDDSLGQNSNNSHVQSESLHSENNLSKPTHFPSTDTNMSHLPVFPQSFSESSSSHPKEDRDIKPQLDEDLSIINVKQEYDGKEDSEGYDISQGAGDGYGGMHYEYYGDGSEVGADYSHLSAGSQGDLYQGGTGIPGDGTAGDSSEHKRTRYSCDLCGKQCRDKTYLQEHKNSVHFHLLPFSCVCGKRFAYKRSCNRHRSACLDSWKNKF